MDDTAEKLTVRGGLPAGGTTPAPKPSKAPRKPKRLLLAFAEDGTIQHTLRDDFFHPFPDAKRSVDRMTSIEFDENKQKFYIEFRRGEHKERGISLKYMIYVVPFGYAVHRENMDFIAAIAKEQPTHDVVWFDMYEKAVITELDIVDRLRKLGFTF